jgi:hypothetical protein
MALLKDRGGNASNQPRHTHDNRPVIGQRKGEKNHPQDGITSGVETRLDLFLHVGGRASSKGYPIGFTQLYGFHENTPAMANRLKIPCLQYSRLRSIAYNF